MNKKILGMVGICLLVLLSLGVGTASAWLSDYDYRTPIEIDDNTEDLTDYQVQIILQGTNSSAANYVDFDKVLTGGADILFTDNDEITEIDFWVEEWVDTSGSESATIWLEVPSVLQAGTKTVYVYYGKSDTTTGPNGDNTFEFFDDFESERDFSKCGVWYSSGSNVYHGGMATYCMWHRPMAVYAASQDKTFFVYGNYDNSPTISFYNHVTGVFADTVVLGTNPGGDAHRNPTILIDEDGYIYVFWGAHADIPTHVTKSTSPYDITSWESKTAIGAHTTYPQPWQLKSGEIFVSYRGDPHKSWCSQKSVDGGENWSDYMNIVDFSTGQIYLVSIAETGPYPRKIHLAWSHMVSTWDQRWDVYYAYSDDGGTTWKKRDGTEYTLPITEANAEKVYESGDEGVWLKDIQLDSNGNPYILFISANRTTYEGTWKFARYSAGSWAITDLTSSDHMYDAGALVILADNDMRIYAPTTVSQAGEDGGDIEEWKSTDGGQTWVNTKHITENSNYSHNNVRTVWNHQKSDFRVLWSYGDSVKPAIDKAVYLYYYGEEQSSANTIFTCDLHSLQWTEKNAENNSITTEEKKHGNSSYKLHDSSSSSITSLTTVSISSNTTGIISSWVKIKSNGYFSLYVYEGEIYHAVVGFYGDGKFRYWDGVNRFTNETYSLDTWYLVTIEFNVTGGKYNFVVCDTDMNEVSRVDDISFGNGTPDELNKFVFTTSLSDIGDVYVDAFRVRKYTATEPTSTTTSAFRGYNKIFTGITNTISATDYVSYSAEPAVSNLVNIIAFPSNMVNITTTKLTTSTSIILDGIGTTNLIVQMPNTAAIYTAKYDGNNCNSSICSFTQSNGELNFSLLLGSEHTLDIEEATDPTLEKFTDMTKTSIALMGILAIVALAVLIIGVLLNIQSGAEIDLKTIMIGAVGLIAFMVIMFVGISIFSVFT